MKALMLMAAILLVICAACSKKGNPVDHQDLPSRFTLSQPQLLIPDGREPEISPDGQWIAFCRRSEATKQDIFIADKDGGNVRQITSDAANENRPFWSPDGRYIGFSSNIIKGKTGSYSVFTVSLENEAVTQISPDSISVQSGDWSPDGRLIVFDGQGERQPDNFLGLWNLATQTLTVLRTELVYMGWPKFSPSGKKVVFEALEKNSIIYNIWSLDIDGTVLTKITADSGEYPCWSPDGQWILYSKKSDGQYDLWVIHPDGSDAEPLTNTKDANEVRACWSSGGDTILYDTMLSTPTVTSNNPGIYSISVRRN